MMDDLISRKSLLSAYDEKHKGPAGGARKLIEDAPSIPAVPLDKLCEWLATWYEPQYNREDLDNMKFPMEHEQQKKIWKRVLTGLMEEWEGQHDGGIGWN